LTPPVAICRRNPRRLAGLRDITLEKDMDGVKTFGEK